MKSYKIVGNVLASINSVVFSKTLRAFRKHSLNSIKYMGVMVAMFAILVASALPSYAWQPRTRIGQRIAARGGIIAKITGARSGAAASCAGSFSVASCGSAVRSTASCSAPAAIPVSAPEPVSAPVYLSAPDCSSGQCTPVRTTVSVVAQSAKGSLEFATRLAREGRMYHDRSYIGYENVASGASSPEDAVRMWMNSPGHRRNMPYITDIQCVNGFCVGR